MLQTVLLRKNSVFVCRGLLMAVMALSLTGPALADPYGPPRMLPPSAQHPYGWHPTNTPPTMTAPSAQYPYGWHPTNTPPTMTAPPQMHSSYPTYSNPVPVYPAGTSTYPGPYPVTPSQTESHTGTRIRASATIPDVDHASPPQVYSDPPRPVVIPATRSFEHRGKTYTVDSEGRLLSVTSHETDRPAAGARASIPSQAGPTRQGLYDEAPQSARPRAASLPMATAASTRRVASAPAPTFASRAAAHRTATMLESDGEPTRTEMGDAPHREPSALGWWLKLAGILVMGAGGVLAAYTHMLNQRYGLHLRWWEGLLASTRSLQAPLRPSPVASLPVGPTPSAWERPPLGDPSVDNALGELSTSMKLERPAPWLGNRPLRP